ncbi:hypothetical protein SAMN06295967_10268 [Belliella buryatensis]|uniref:Potassium transporter KefB n=1 Tax=Belliella buryatensis TaxID=1500549 RepID=A0A239B1F0_9BACT|nr:hypothetical protein [Belliella buryatensis]SNS01786.1 hypothetical protein SAMN06295967_10268 [Belliella buryatensis]
MENQQLSKGINPKNLLLSGLLGAFLPFAVLAIIILTKEDVFETWMLFPLTIIPAGGVFGGLFFYLMGFQWFSEGNRKLIAVIFSTLFYFIALWISSVLAFSITGHWD